MESLVVWGLVLLGASLLLIVVEVFVPSAGLISLASAAVGIAGLVCLYKHDWVWGLIGTLCMLVLAPVVFMTGLNIMPSTPFGKKLLFGESGKDEPVMPTTLTPEAMGKLVGAEGKALTDLRPVGTISIDSQRLQARSEISLIRSGTMVRVTGVDGPVLKVRPVA